MSDLSEEILYGDYNGVVKLLKRGANVNKRDRYGLIPLVQAAIRDNV
jgi:ankyrin repeat protein